MRHNTFDIDDTDTTAEVLDMMSTSVRTIARAEGDASEMFTFEKNGKSLEMEAFMEEGLVVELHTTTDENQPPVVFVGVNNDQRWLPRGVPVRIQRKFIERLAQCKEAKYDTPDNRDPNADNAKSITRRQAHPYGFSVISDPNPKGREWLRSVLRQPT